MNFDKKETQNKSRLDEIKEELYSRKGYTRDLKRSNLKSKKFDIESSWGKEDSFSKEENNKIEIDDYKKRKGPSIFSIIFISSLVFFMIAAISAFFFIFLSGEENINNVNLSVTGPNVIKSGDVLEFQVKIDNPTELEYEEIELVISFPESTLDAETKQFIESKSMEAEKDLLPGGFINEKIRVILSGAKDEEKDIKIVAYYKAKDYSSILSIQKVYKIGMEDSSVYLDIRNSEEVLSGKEFNIELDVISNSKNPIKELIINTRYPNSFEISNTEPKAVFSEISQNVFKIEDLNPGEIRTIKITGKIIGQNDERKFFLFEIGDAIPGTNEMRTLFAKSEKEISIKKPDIELSVFNNNESNNDYVVAFPDQTIRFNLNIINNLTSIVSNLKVVGNISGDFFKEDKIKTPRGFYDSNKNELIWDKNTDNNLGAMIGSQKIEEEFSITIMPFKEIAGYVKDPKIVINFSASGTNFDNPNSEGDVLDSVEKIIKIPTQVGLSSRIIYHSGPFINSGSTRPVVGKETTYTAEWKIYNSNSDIEDVKVVAKLPPYVRFIGNTSPENSYLSYNEETREITWLFNKISAFIGYRTDPKTVSFQVGFIPSATQIGSKPILILEKKLSAKDDYINRKIEVVSSQNDTSLKNDINSSYKDGVVVGN